jgi:diamine N-acetyltransferase
VNAVLAEAKRRGQHRATVLWVPGPGGPENFYLRLGFRPTGETFHGQAVGQIDLG